VKYKFPRALPRAKGSYAEGTIFEIVDFAFSLDVDFIWSCKEKKRHSKNNLESIPW